MPAADVDVLVAHASGWSSRSSSSCARGAASRPPSWSWRIVRPCRRVRDALRAGASDVVDASAADHVAARGGRARGARRRSFGASCRCSARASAMRRSRRSSAGRRRWRTCVSSSDAPRGSRVPVVITGEPGTGKDVVARLVHDLSERASRPYRRPCAAATASTGGARARAVRDDGAEDASRAGLLERVRGGTVVLEDASSLPPALRAQLSRVAPHAPDAARRRRRIRCRPTCDLGARIVRRVRGSPRARMTGRSIEDLLERVQRDADRRAAAARAAQRHSAARASLPPSSRRRAGDRAAADVAGRHAAAARTRVDGQRARAGALGRACGARDARGATARGTRTLRRRRLSASAQATLEQLERAYILHVLAREGGHQSRDAARLGIDRRTLYRKLKQYRIEAQRSGSARGERRRSLHVVDRPGPEDRILRRHAAARREARVGVAVLADVERDTARG